MQTLLNPGRKEYGGRDDMPGNIHYIQKECIQSGHCKEGPMILICFNTNLITFGGN
jgi:hypothetical protein